MQKAKIASLLLLTMPGVPFVYYGEEIGMTGTKPDERLRTPMQWRRVAADGFTTGKAWEALQDDSSSVTVEAEESDSTSLLNLHRRLIHLRAAFPALGEGELVPLAANVDGVATYLRRSGDQRVLIVANLTNETRNVVVTAKADALPAGKWRLRSLLDSSMGGVAPPPTEAGYPASAIMLRDPLGPYEGRIFLLERDQRTRTR